MNGSIFLVHWHPIEAQALAREIRAYGWEVSGIEAEEGVRAAQAIRENPPDVLVVFLTRLPAHGRRTAAYVQSLKATAALPLIFVGGKEAAVERTRVELPDALYVSAEALPAALESVGASLRAVP